MKVLILGPELPRDAPPDFGQRAARAIKATPSGPPEVVYVSSPWMLATVQDNLLISEMPAIQAIEDCWPHLKAQAQVVAALNACSRAIVILPKHLGSDMKSDHNHSIVTNAIMCVALRREVVSDNGDLLSLLMAQRLME